MLKTIITSGQIFGIGFGFGIAGPCLFSCVPVILAYCGGTGKPWKKAFGDAGIFLAGRLSAYMLLGLAAGISAAALRQFLDPRLQVFLVPAGGLVSVLLGAAVIAGLAGPGRKKGECPSVIPGAGLFAAGFIVGVSPCGPLLALLFEITLISRNWSQGLWYAFCFGLGTLVSGLLVLGLSTGILCSVPPRFLRSNDSLLFFRVACGLFLIALGAGLLISGKRL